MIELHNHTEGTVTKFDNWLEANKAASELGNRVWYCFYTSFGAC